jgi:hypothetical protein
LGNCGVVDLVDNNGEVALTIGGLSGIFKGHDYLKVELVSKELNHLAAILHVYARGLSFMK